VVTQSGASTAQSAQVRSTFSACTWSHRSMPAYALAMSKSRSSIEVTIPKLPPPPRTAQNTSGLVSASARSRLPSPSTRSTPTMLLVDMPSWRAYHPMPPPSE
jgi:hypothetical protein